MKPHEAHELIIREIGINASDEETFIEKGERLMEILAELERSAYEARFDTGEEDVF